MAATRPPPDWIAELRVVMVHPDGRRVPGHIAVGRPYTLGDGDPAGSFESHCPVEIDGLHSQRHPIIGAGTIQALLLGVRFLGTMLHNFTSRGGRVLHATDGTDVDLESLFGPMLSDSMAFDDEPS
jgi:hypothetical protein